jgi:hypothetical protein
MFQRLYNFIRTPENRGVGTGAMALARPQTDPIQSLYGPRYNVQRHLGPSAPAFMKWRNQVVPVSILGNGSYLQGQLALQALVDMEKGRK